MSSITPPPAPDYHFDLPDEEVRRLQKILNSEGGYQYSELEAKLRGIELLELFRMLMDPEADEERRQRQSPGPKMVPPPSPPPEPQAFPIRLDANHAYEVESSLRMLEYELGRVKQFPTSWRWAVVAAYNALGHALVMRRPAEPRDAVHHLLELFDAVTEDMPAIQKSREAIEQLEMLRTTWLPRPIGEWPVRRTGLERLMGAANTSVRQMLSTPG